jgi:transposase-like protein
MDERVRFIGRVLSGNAGMAALCREFGISPKTDYKWLERYCREVMAGLAEHSHAPLRHGRALDVTVVQAVLGLRERWPGGWRKLRAKL